jgi:hypothetical protein
MFYHLHGVKIAWLIELNGFGTKAFRLRSSEAGFTTRFLEGYGPEPLRLIPPFDEGWLCMEARQSTATEQQLQTGLCMA